MGVLVLGAYGLIGTAVVDRLVRDGHRVSGLGRDRLALRRGRPDVRWIRADLAGLTEPGSWEPLLESIDCVVNAAGALQDGARDRVVAVQLQAMLALYRACEASGVRRIVQISAVGADSSAGSDFLRTKARADAALADGPLEWVVLRPGLVLSPQAYGGTALLRALASLPWMMPVVHGERPLQTVSIDDLADAVSRAVGGSVPSGTTADLVEEASRPLAAVARQMRRWLGHAPAVEVTVPAAVGRLIARVADALGWLGWRSPLRSSAMAAVEAGVVGDAARWRALTGQRLSSLEETLAALPSTVQERWFARMWLLRPAVLGTLSAFWTFTGVVTLVDVDAAASVLTGAGVPEVAARAAAVGGALADIVLGAGVLVRSWHRAALLGMLGLTLAYLVAATAIVPALWLDPLGPLVKAVPSMVLALVGLALADDR